MRGDYLVICQSWQRITNDHTILQYVKGIKIEFINDQSPTANNFAAGALSYQQTLNQSVAQDNIQKVHITNIFLAEERWLA
jgi:hypothetical protein